MEIRSVQKTGKMHYVYMPTNWCRKHKISSNTKVAITEQNDGSLLIAPEIKPKKQKTIELTIPAKYQETLLNLIMACYVNPAHSFRIKMEKKVNIAELFDTKTIVSGLEFVELDGDHITYEANMTIQEPDTLLKTMVKKIKNLLSVMIDHYSPALVEKYEEEIDRSKTLIQKSVISAFVQNESTKLKAIDLHYTIQIALELERMVDHLIQEKSDKSYLKKLVNLIDLVKGLIENIDSLDYLKAAHFTKEVLSLPREKQVTTKTYRKERIRGHLLNVAEVILDWSITKATQN